MVGNSAVFLQHSNTPSLKYSTMNGLLVLKKLRVCLIIGHSSGLFNIIRSTDLC